MNTRLRDATLSASIALLLGFPLICVKLNTVDISLQLAWAPTDHILMVVLGSLTVFIWQLTLQDSKPGTGVDRLTAGWREWLGNLGAARHGATRQQHPALLKALLGLIFILAVSWPFVLAPLGINPRAPVDIATLILIYVMLGLGLNIVVGFAGLLDLGYAGFYAVGAYTYALLSHYSGWGFWACLPLAGLLAATFGFLLGFPVLRLRGDYLAIVTLGFGEIIRILLRNSSTTGGPNGISNIERPTLFGLSFERQAPEGLQTFHEFFGIAYNPAAKVIFLYLIAVLLVTITLLVINRLLRMPIGRAWEALREDEIACRALGLNPTLIKLSAFTLGACFAGFAGCFFAARQGLVTPESFSFIESATILAIVVLGGMGSQLGIILAAVIMTLLPELMRDFSEFRMLLFGLLMVVMMRWRPQGLIPTRRPVMPLEEQA